ncbi:MaoC family dehydratase [Parvibaculum sp.]|jgi:acyl dehydratase|uniref:MaoC family dehydratase n=1 Tax=Parvibaculum sp. TaxID=2024848 RepID=UPI000C8BA3A7|nr:MaoC family dehydratase [Parvibaculum sp.]MAB12315.1 dehydratase [Parvibaculum sp.]|tara:strand:+ start:145 stop:606 length:462 start_codon:yes stop_codon:yes gene_type:complete
MPGLYFEEFEEGQLFKHAITRTVTEADNTFFSTMTMNPAALHIDHDYAARETEFGKPLVNSLLTLGMMIGISVHETTHMTTIANLGMTDVVFPKPVFHGDTLRIETKVMGKRRSKSRPKAGIVTFEHKAYNQHGEEVASCTRQAFMHAKTESE